MLLVLMASCAEPREDQTAGDEGGDLDAGAGQAPASFTADIFATTEQNDLYRRVVHTGARSQLAVMSIPPGESIGTETHGHVEQTIVIVSGTGQVRLGEKRTNLGGGDVIVVTPGTTHDLRNVGQSPLKLFTIYSPPNHIDGRLHATKQDAESDVEDQRFGRSRE